MKRRKAFELAAGIAGIVLVAAITIAWLVYPSRPDIALKRAWNRLTAAVGRPTGGDVVLPIIFDAQDHSLSCEIAALKMALAIRGIHVSESELLTTVGFDTTPKRQEAGRIVWGDPQIGFVGDIDGRMPDTGYGVYGEPLARAARNWRAAQYVKGITPRKLAEELIAGNPVIVWGYLGDGAPYEWQTPNGETVHAVLNEHTFTAYGFRGDVNQPEGFLLMDPIYGPRYWDTDELFDRMEKLGYSAVILY